jgi:hypothetical protein
MNWNNIRGNKIKTFKNHDMEKNFIIIEKRIIYIIKNQFNNLCQTSFNLPNKYGTWLSI